MRFAEALNNTKIRMMKAFERRDRETVAEITDYLVGMIIQNIASEQLVTEAYGKKAGITEAEVVKDIFAQFGSLGGFAEALRKKEIELSEGYAFEEED